MRIPITCVLAALITPAAANANVAGLNDSGFVSHNEALVAATPAETWATLLQPGGWWNGEHTYSGDPANMTIDPKAGGCFCEAIPGADGAAGGQVEHMRVIYVAPGSALRMRGALGPLQVEAVTGVLTVSLEPKGQNTKVTFDYVVGGYMRTPMAEIAPAVDSVVGEQLMRLAARLGPTVDGPNRRGSR